MSKEQISGYTRSESREQAFMLLFSRMFCGDPFETFFEDNADMYRDGISPYAAAAVPAIEESREELDAKIAEFLKQGWSVSRISKTSLAILRLAFYEIKNIDSVPVSVTISEAVLLAKKYTLDEYKFVNGVLGAYARSIEPEIEL